MGQNKHDRKSRERNRRSCLICGKDAERINGHKKMVMNGARHFDLRYCEKCQFWFIDPMPSIDFLETWYGNKPVQRMYRDAKYRDEEIYPVYWEILTDFIQPYDGCKVLEIGYYAGDFLRRFWEEGCQCWGIDIHPAYKVYVESKYNHEIQCYVGTLFSAPLRQTKFNLIVFNQVLEHQPDPMGFLKRVKHLLAEHGLVFFTVPNIDDARTIKKRMDYPNHLCYFTVDSAIKMVEAAGLKHIRSETYLGRSGVAVTAGHI